MFIFRSLMIGSKRKYCTKFAAVFLVSLALFKIATINSSNMHFLIDEEVTESNSNKCGMNHEDDSWLARQNLNYNTSAGDGHWTAINRKLNQDIRPYSMGDVANCLNSIQTSCSQSDNNKALRFIFIGDSRSRLQFFNFLKFIPDFDLEYEPDWQKAGIYSAMDFHIDRNISSPLIGVNVSFLWRHKFDNGWINETVNWLQQPPYMIVMGGGMHNLLRTVDDRPPRKLHLFQEMLHKLLPAFRQLIAAGTKLIWMSQFHILPDNKEPEHESLNGTIFSETVQVADNYARRILKGSGVKFWDSGNIAVDENIRACVPMNGALKREPWMDVFYHNSYFKCHDRFHPSYTALSHSMQIFFNFLCNRHMK